MVVDTSVIIAVLFDETHGAWGRDRLKEHASSLAMSTVNLAETLILIRDRKPRVADRLETALLSTGIDFIPPDIAAARIAAVARVSLPLNLGDCFAYALAVTLNCPILTLDADFRRVSRPVVMPP